MVARRVAGEPLEQILGWAEFCGLRVVVERGVFVPRRRSALLVREALRLLAGVQRPVVVDLCCGTGAIGLAVVDGLVHAEPDVLTSTHRRVSSERQAQRVPQIELHAADVDPVAVRCARRNIDGTGTVHEGDLFDALPPDLRGRVDVLVVNAPYVPTDAIATMPPEARDHEPRWTLDGGADGVDVHRRVAAHAADWLRAGGHVVIETGRTQAAITLGAFEQNGLAGRVVADDELDATAVVGVRR